MRAQVSKLVINQKPRGQGRPRFTSKPFPRAYESATDKKYKKLVVDTFKKEYSKGNVIILDDDKKPLEVLIVAYVPIPSRLTKAQRKLVDCGEIQPSKKPDADNIAKIVIDALTGVAWKADDSLINSLYVSKKFATDDNPRVEIFYNYLDK